MEWTMPIPDFQTMMLPFLKAAGDGNERSVHYFVEILAKEFNVSQEEFSIVLAGSKLT
jgi:restriction system protein